jgi:hypothetical protein
MECAAIDRRAPLLRHLNDFAVNFKISAAYDAEQN